MGSAWIVTHKADGADVVATIVTTAIGYQITWAITKPGKIDRQMLGFPTLEEARNALLAALDAHGIASADLVFEEVIE